MSEYKNFTHVRFFDIDGKEELIDIKEFSFNRFTAVELHDIAVLDERALLEDEEKSTIVKVCLYVHVYPNNVHYLNVSYQDNNGHWSG